LATKYWKLAGRRGRKKALIAVAHKILTIIYHLLLTHKPYVDLGSDYLESLNSKDARARKLVKQLKALGYEVPNILGA
jgi:hypothetical protein